VGEQLGVHAADPPDAEHPDAHRCAAPVLVLDGAQDRAPTLPRVSSGSAPAADRPVRLALLGLGRMGRFHLAALETVPEVDVVALAEPFAAARAAASELRPRALAYDHVTAALAHPDVEACLVATPTMTHPDVVAAAIAAGLHVLCEKPLALDPAEADRLGALAERAGRVLQVGFWRRFAPPWRRAKEAIDEGRIGRPLLARLAQWDADPPPASFCDPAVSGGLAIDCGVHEYDLAEWLTGRRAIGVRAWTLPIVDADLAAAGDVDNLLAVLQLDDGAVATVDLSRNARFGDDVRTEVLGADGALFVDALPTGHTRLGDAAGVRQLECSATDDAMAAGVAAQAAAFAAKVRGAAVDVPGAAASARATRIGAAVIEAARTGAEVDLTTA
jgi:predicted dehydrogenase